MDPNRRNNQPRNQKDQQDEGYLTSTLNFLADNQDSIILALQVGYGVYSLVKSMQSEKSDNKERPK